MNARHKAVIEWFRLDDEGQKDIEALCVQHSIELDDFGTAIDELFYRNDVESAAVAIAGLELTLDVERDDDLYHEAVQGAMGEHCPLIWAYYDARGDFPESLALRLENLMEVIFDGAERIGATTPAIAI